MKTKTEEVPHEVKEFLEAQDRIIRYREAHPDVFETYEELASTYNDKLEAADKVVRGGALSVGPFEKYQVQNSYDADKLFEEVGMEKFLAMGGTIKTKAVYEVDPNRLKAAIAQGTVPADVVKKVHKETPKYHKPQKLVVR